jgi:hypothetical protein
MKALLFHDVPFQQALAAIPWRGDGARGKEP